MTTLIADRFMSMDNTIKIDIGKIVHLQGCEGGGAFNDGGNGNWMTDGGFKFSGAGWNTSYVKNQLDNIGDLGANGDDALKVQKNDYLSYGASVATFGIDFNTGKSVRVC